jgi:putative ABC transport system permease protein
VEVFQVSDSAVDVGNDIFMVVPLKFAQSLYDTSSVDRVVVLLNGSGETEQMQRLLTQALSGRGLDVEVSTWRELDRIYSRVKNMFDIIFLFIFVIVFVIVVMSVVNTMSMAVMERTREIGTLRALGVRRAGIVKLFSLESAMLGAAGSGLGVLLTLASWVLVNVVIQPTWVPPILSRRVPLEIYLVPAYLLYSGAFLILLSVVAAIFPARKAAHQEVVDALGHV